MTLYEILTLALPVLTLLMSPVIVGLVVCICIGQYRSRQWKRERQAGFPVTPKQHT